MLNLCKYSLPDFRTCLFDPELVTELGGGEDGGGTSAAEYCDWLEDQIFGRTFTRGKFSNREEALVRTAERVFTKQTMQRPGSVLSSFTRLTVNR